jgi:hypothetical protein
MAQVPHKCPRWPWLTVAVVFVLMEICCQAQVPVKLELGLQSPGLEIPFDFVGLSFEMQRVLPDTNGSHFFSPDNQPLIATFKTLGIKNLRVGGNTADRPTLPVPSQIDVDHLFGFAKAANVKVIYTLRLNQGDPAAAAEMANYISRHYAGQLDCFVIGNEPNVFSTNFDVYLAEWKRFAAQITAPSNSPDAKFCGPSVSPGHEKWSAQFAQDLAATGLLKYISQHDYTGGDARKVTNPEAARDKILSPAMEARYAKFAANFVSAAASNGLTYRFEEANSFYDGGAADVSDTFASALWALNYQWWWATRGMEGINFHTGDKVAARDESKPCRYATFWTTPNGFNIHPIGYAEKMFSLGSRGKIVSWNLSYSATNFNFTAYAIRGNDGSVYVTLINFSHGDTATNCSVQISARTPVAWADGEIIRLATPDGDVSRKSGVTLGSAEIADDANWAGQWEHVSLPDNPQSPVTVTMPPASAAVVKLAPRRQP